MSISSEKRLLREKYALPEVETERAAERLLTFPPFLRAKSVFCYVSGKNELSTWPLLRFCLERGVTLCVPRCYPGREMRAHVITSENQLTPGFYGLLEPPEDAPVLENPEIAIVPGLAFDRIGYRLGRGGGYYDRWLAGRDCLKIGLCRTGALADSLPRDAYDQRVDMICTPEEIFRV